MSAHTPDPIPGGAVPATPAVTGPETVEPAATVHHPETVLRLEGVRKSFGDTVVLGVSPDQPSKQLKFAQ